MTYRLPALVVLIAATIWSAHSKPETKVWLIGGGNTLENSQGQIEENVRWLQTGLKRQGIPTKTYFTHGNEHGHDVIYYAPSAERDNNLEVILRVIRKGLAYAQVKKKNTLESVDGSTEKKQLLRSLSRDFDEANPDDHIVLIYNGHGDIDSKDTRKNSLKLWQDTRLEISELDALLDKLPQQTNVSFVLTQCFSGSFAGLVYESPFDRTPANQSRCGFLAESDRREAEGCDLGINQEEFRDYTTYFFAALFGQDRLGNPIPLGMIDRDKSGKVSFYEAHLYTLENAQSSDLSRSSSEVLLEQEQSWYTRWDTWRQPPPNQYTDIAEKVSERESLPDHGFQLVKAVLKLHKKHDGLQRESRQLKLQIKELQTSIQRTHSIENLTMHELSIAEIDSLATKLKGHTEFQLLVEKQNQQEELNKLALEANRALVQAEKILRMNRLARLLHWNSSQETETVQECEKSRYL